MGLLTLIGDEKWDGEKNVIPSLATSHISRCCCRVNQLFLSLRSSIPFKWRFYTKVTSREVGAAYDDPQMQQQQCTHAAANGALNIYVDCLLSLPL